MEAEEVTAESPLEMRFISRRPPLRFFASQPVKEAPGHIVHRNLGLLGGGDAFLLQNAMENAFMAAYEGDPPPLFPAPAQISEAQKLAREWKPK